jgi:hypothetical protein
MELASMAMKTDLDKLYFPGYFYPTLQAHATTLSIFHRLKSSDQNLSFNENTQPDIADKSLIIEHNLIIRLVDIQNDYFNLDLSNDKKLLIKDFKGIWGKSTGH